MSYNSEADTGYGASFSYGDGASPEAFTQVAEVEEIIPGGGSTEVIKVTHLQSPGEHHEKLLALRDTGPFKIKGNLRLDHASQDNATGLVFKWRTKWVGNWKLAVPTEVFPEDGWIFRGGVTNFTPGPISGNDKMAFEAEITPTGDPYAEL